MRYQAELAILIALKLWLRALNGFRRKPVEEGRYRSILRRDWKDARLKDARRAELRSKYSQSALRGLSNSRLQLRFYTFVADL